MRSIVLILTVAILALVTFGCSGNSEMLPAAAPLADAGINRTSGGYSHCCLGLWQAFADPESQTLDFIKMREATLHLNALPFLEPPPLLNLTLEYLEFNGDEIIADIGLRHPFLGLTEFTGFDVCGVFISNGSATFGDTGLTYAGENDTHLLNPDGLTRWWNPSEFPSDGTIFNYKDGLLGAPDSIADFSSEINGYKYYCDELDDIEDDILECTPEGRGIFNAGMHNIRRFHIKLGNDGLIFNYAIDANWIFPQGDHPWTAPDDFPAEANRPEAWAISVTELNNTLFNDGTLSGGDLSLLIDVYDHFNADINAVKVQSPGNFDEANSATPTNGGEGYSTYQIDITNATPAEGSIPLYIIIESEEEGYGDKIPGEPISAYFLNSAEVSGVAKMIQVTSPNGAESWQAFTEQEITWNSIGMIDEVKIEYSKDGFTSDINIIIESTENDGSYMWTIPPDPSDTVRVRITDTAASGTFDISDNDFSIIAPDCVIHVDDDNVSGPWDGTIEHPFKLFQDGVDAVDEEDCVIWVHPGTYNEDDGGSMYSGLGEVTINSLTNLTIWGEDYPVLHMPMNLTTGRAAIHAYNSPDLTIDGIAFSHNYAYQSANWFDNCAKATVKNCKMVPTLSPHVYGFLEFVRGQNCQGLRIENNDCDDFNTASTYMSLFVLSGCNNAIVTLNTCRNMNYHTGYNLYQTAEGYVSCYNSSSVEVSKNIFGDHHRSCSSTNYVRFNGIYIYGGSENTVRNNLIFDCSFRDSSSGQSNNQAIYAVNSPDIEIYNNTIDRFGPTVSTGTGTTYGIIVENSDNPGVYNNIITNLYNPQFCYGISGSTTFKATYSDVWTLTGATTARFHNLATEGTGCIETDPMYNDALTEDYSLQSGSPCAGTGLDGEDMGCHGGTDPLPE